MRQVFCNGLVQQARLPEFVFLTGDLGFKALEPLQDALGPRFINAGVSEQNMISVAAGLARSGLRPWAYSIAPFLYARPFEQIRNDVCFHDLPVILVGNGGGYGYGVMGSSHHALEDYGCLLTLPHMRAFVPAFDSDVNTMIPMLMQCKGPAYFRLGLSEEPKDWPIPAYAPWRKLLSGNGPVLAGVGPLLGGMLTTLQQLREDVRPEVWLVTELPIANVPDEFIAGVRRARRLFVVEEHTAHGGFGQMLAHHLAAAGVGLDSFIHKHALGHCLRLIRVAKVPSCGMRPGSRLDCGCGLCAMSPGDPLKPNPAGNIRQLQGPILVLGASGFIGANLFLALLEHREDVYGTATRLPAWRLEGLPRNHILVTDLLIDSNLDALLESVKPRTIFDCIAYGAYSFETDRELIYRTNFNLISRLLGRLDPRTLSCYVHAGSSSEYGDNSSGPREDAAPEPNSHYSVSKVAAASLIHYLGKKKGLPCANLRLYSAYGPLEDSSRLIPNIVHFGAAGGYPELVDPRVSRDFIYVDDVADAFIDIGLKLTEADYGESFNIGTGRKTTIGDIVTVSQRLFRHTPGSGIHDA